MRMVVKLGCQLLPGGQALTLAQITRPANLLGRIVTEIILHLESVYLPNAILH